MVKKKHAFSSRMNPKQNLNELYDKMILALMKSQFAKEEKELSIAYLNRETTRDQYLHEMSGVKGAPQIFVRNFLGTAFVELQVGSPTSTDFCILTFFPSYIHFPEIEKTYPNKSFI